jgi:hypothetical protein
MIRRTAAWLGWMGECECPYVREIAWLFLCPAYMTVEALHVTTGAYLPLVGGYGPGMRAGCVSRAAEHAASSCLCWWAHVSRP